MSLIVLNVAVCLFPLDAAHRFAMPFFPVAVPGDHESSYFALDLFVVRIITICVLTRLEIFDIECTWSWHSSHSFKLLKFFWGEITFTLKILFNDVCKIFFPPFTIKICF